MVYPNDLQTHHAIQLYTQVSLLAAYIGLLTRASTAWEQIQKYQADGEKPRLRMDGKALGHNLDS